MDNWRPGGMMLEKQQGMEVLGAYLSPPVSIKNRSLTTLLSCWTHAPHLTGRISHSDREAWTLSRLGIEPPWAVLVMVEENDEGVARNLGIPWIPRSSERSSGMGGACRTCELVLDSAIWWPVAHFGRWVWFVWGINHQLVRNRFELPSLLDSEHLTWAQSS